MSSVAAIIVAAGRSERFGGGTPKLLVPWEGRPLLAWTLGAFDACSAVGPVVLVMSEAMEQAWERLGRPGAKVQRVARGGATRQASVMAGTAALPDGIDIVVIHDGARPFVTPRLIAAVVEAARRSGAALPLLPVADTVKSVVETGGTVSVSGTVARDRLRLAQTPQGFRLDVLRRAQRHAVDRGIEATDDVALVESALEAGVAGDGVTVEGVTGESANVKVTRPSDLPAWTNARVGLGHDVHPLETGRRFVLAGIDLHAGLAETERFGPRGHSDGDALSHAICDALLGAAGLGDIGQHFPDTRDENLGRPSLEFVRAVAALLAAEGWRIGNVSAVVRLESPTLAPAAPAIRAALAQALGVPVGAVGLSAKRGEGLGAVGTGAAVACDAVALIERQA